MVAKVNTLNFILSTGILEDTACCNAPEIFCAVTLQKHKISDMFRRSAMTTIFLWEISSKLFFPP